MKSLDDAGRWRRHIHGGLVRFQRHQRILHRHRVTDRHKDLDHGYLAKVPDVRDRDRELPDRGAHTVVGSGADGSISSRLIASATCFSLIAPSSASPLSALTATSWRSTSKKRGHALR